MFTGASSGVTITPSADSLPSFPMYAAFPRSEYYDGSAPPQDYLQAVCFPFPNPGRAGGEGAPERFPCSLVID
ncbi:hypothetical protein Atai01_69180 [Amycolatopsis taiwanensis]|uniref:Uncharacterized protein n=1 Tax=Amycolatopsis taiwanensis TaxID=342230 RepID=A0A9W6VK73_9PSEU|nr:hypothetical protein Atai01_69180 [Amycolatopsis taiwanensis]